MGEGEIATQHKSAESTSDLLNLKTGKKSKPFFFFPATLVRFQQAAQQPPTHTRTEQTRNDEARLRDDSLNHRAQRHGYPLQLPPTPLYKATDFSHLEPERRTAAISALRTGGIEAA